MPVAPVVHWSLALNGNLDVDVMGPPQYKFTFNKKIAVIEVTYFLR
jgi:hypothetical protein